MKTIIVTRYQNDDNHTIGNCIVVENGTLLFSSVSLERGWLDNKLNVSCIPLGEYPVKIEYSPSFNKDLWEVKDVPGRSEIKFHVANYWKQLQGCFALGLDIIDIDSDGTEDITSSTSTIDRFHKVMKNDKEAKLIVKQHYII